MRIRTIRDLEIHRGEPSTEAPVKGIIYEGFELEVEGPVEGEALDGNDLWYRIGEDYYWSGGAVEVAQDEEDEGEVAVEGEGDRAGRPADIPFPAESVNWNSRIRWSGATEATRLQEWEATGGRGVKVAVLDSGIYAGHPDLAHLRADRMADFSGSDFGYEDRDVIGHGTQMAGLINARSDRGVTGVAPQCELYIGKVTHEDFSHSAESVSNAIDWAIGQEVDIINMSLEIRDADKTKLEAAVRRASDAGIILVASAGNQTMLVGEEIHYPAMYDRVISVGAVDESFLKQNRKPIHPEVDLLLPYRPMLSCSTEADNYYREASGVSMTTALVSGVIALILSYRRRQGESSTSDDIMRQLFRFSYEFDNTLDLSGEQIPIMRI